MPTTPTTTSAPAQAETPAATASRIAFSLGWGMATLYREGLPQRVAVTTPGKRLPGVGRLSVAQRALLHLDQIDAALALLKDQLGDTGLQVPNTDAARGLVEVPNPDGSVGKAAIFTLHLELLRLLTATDFRLGKAYGLGRALADTCSAPESIDALCERFSRHRLDVLRTWLNDSASNLPPYSAKAVLVGLCHWEAWVANLRAKVEPDDWEPHAGPIAKTLHRQAEMWRSALSGERDPRDSLTVDSYIKAARSAMRALNTRLVTTLRPLLLRYGALLALILIAVVAFLAVVMTGGTSQLVLEITAVAGIMGISGKTLSTVLQRLGALLEQPVWGAEVNTAVGEALTNLPLVPVAEPRPDLLIDTPIYLRAVSDAPCPDLGGITQALNSASIHRGRKLSRADKRSIRPGLAPWHQAPEADLDYWLNWAVAAGYVQLDAAPADAQAGSSARYTLTDEGSEFAAIPARERSTVCAALTAARTTSDGKEDKDEQGPVEAADGQETVAVPALLDLTQGSEAVPS